MATAKSSKKKETLEKASEPQTSGSTMKRQDDGSVVLTIAIPFNRVEEVKNKVIEQAAEGMTLPGFRKGKAPRELVEKQLSNDRVNEEILRKLLPEFYIQAVQEHKIQPIINPKIHVEKMPEGEPWVFSATTAELPKIGLNDYKKAVKDVTAKSKIIVPGKEEQKVDFDQVLNVLLEHTNVAIPHVIIDEEVDRRLAQTLDEIRHLGLTLDQYLSSTGKSVEQLREEFHKKAEHDIKLELALQKIADDEKLQVSEQELDEAIGKATDEKERQNLQENRYMLANILRQQKTFDFLRNL